MEQAFVVVVVALTVVCGAIALFTLAASARTYGQIGGGGTAPASSDRDAGAGTGERDEEIRQMLQARNARRARRGEDPIDVDAQLAALVAPSVDEQLREEVRQLVLGRNERRELEGQSPLDVEREVARRLRELT